MKLSGVKPYESTEHVHRFRISLNPNQELSFPVKEVKSDETTLSIRDIDRPKFGIVFSGTDVPAGLRTKLETLIEEREKIAELRTQRTPLDSRITAILEDQVRLRENLKALRETNEDRELRKKYLGQLAVQEAQIAELRTRINEILRQIQDQETLVEKLIADFRWN